MWRTDRPRKTKIGIEVAHVSRDSDTTFKVKGQLRSQGVGHIVAATAQLVLLVLNGTLSTNRLYRAIGV